MHPRVFPLLPMIAFLAGSASAQTPGLPPPSQPTASSDAATRDWATLSTVIRTPVPPGSGAAAKTTIANTYVSRADQLRAFHQKYPQNRLASEARRQEVVTLALAAINGATAHDTRRTTLLNEVRSDPALPASSRFEAVALCAQVTISRQRPRARDAFLATQETTTRGLIGEFPAVPDGYESLGAIARESALARGTAIARELTAMRTAPATVRTDAQRLIERNGLPGQSFTAIVTQTGAASQLGGNRNQVAVVFTWSTKTPGVLPAIKRLTTQVSQVRFIGVCLDTDVPAARAALAASGVGGEHYFDARGPGAPFTQALKSGAQPEIYLVDRTGVIRDVQGRDDFRRKVTALQN